MKCSYPNVKLLQLDCYLSAASKTWIKNLLPSPKRDGLGGQHHHRCDYFLKPLGSIILGCFWDIQYYNDDYFTIITIIGPTINCNDASPKSRTITLCDCKDKWLDKFWRKMGIDSVKIPLLIARFVGSSSQTLTGSRLLHPQRLVLWSGEGITVCYHHQQMSTSWEWNCPKHFAEQKIYFGFTVHLFQQFWRTLWIVWSDELRCLWDLAQIEIIFNSSFTRLCQSPDQNQWHA